MLHLSARLHIRGKIGALLVFIEVPNVPATNIIGIWPIYGSKFHGSAALSGIHSVSYFKVKTAFVKLFFVPLYMTFLAKTLYF